MPKLPILLLLASLAISCSSTTEPTPQPKFELPSACREYDDSRGGIQITCIYYDQQTNAAKAGEYNEWVMLAARGTVNTTGWRLNAGDSTQDFMLPATIKDSLVVYTRAVPSWLTAPAGSFGSSGERWLWNNSEPDTARIIDAQGNVVDMFTYKGK